MKILKKIYEKYKKFDKQLEKLDKIELALGRIEQRQIFLDTSTDFKNKEFQVFSQWGEDGIIQYLINKVPIENRIFIEFGVENYLEANTRFLLINNNWSGLIIDGSKAHIDYVKKDPIYWRYNLKAIHSFITKDNINELFLDNGISGDIGLLSIDIDGNDYWIWDAINVINPRIVVCEYNSLFGPELKVTVPYSSTFTRSNYHFSNLVFGASISALCDLGKKKGYTMIGSNFVGNNLFFVRNDLLSVDLKESKASLLYIKTQFREALDEQGKLNFFDFEERLKMVENIEVIDIETNNLLKIKDLK